MPEHSGHIASIPIRGLAMKLLLPSLVLAAFAMSIIAAKWQIGGMLAEVTSPTQDGAYQVAEAAVALAPGDPLPRWLLGASLRSDFTAAGIERSNRSIRDAVRLSPNHYRWWSELGRSYEQLGQDEAAENAIRRAVSLAPDYTLPNWQLGNFYLRRGRVDDAIAPLQTAARYNPRYRGQVFAVAWSFFGGDTTAVERFAMGDPDSLASLATFYAGVDRPEDALRTWNRLSEEEKNANRPIAADAARKLFDKKRFVTAAEFSREAGMDRAARPGAFTNGDFETGIKEPDTFLFDWTAVRTDSRADIATDSSVAHGGKRSLRVLFRAFAKTQFFDIQQLIAVRPESRQRIEFWLRTENLRSGSMPLFAVLHVETGGALAMTEPFPTGTNEWQRISIEFDVPTDTEGVRLVSTREPCPAECPLSGIFWVDDFNIKEIRP